MGAKARCVWSRAEMRSKTTIKGSMTSAMRRRTLGRASTPAVEKKSESVTLCNIMSPPKRCMWKAKKRVFFVHLASWRGVCGAAIGERGRKRKCDETGLVALICAGCPALLTVHQLGTLPCKR